MHINVVHASTGDFYTGRGVTIDAMVWFLHLKLSHKLHQQNNGSTITSLGTSVDIMLALYLAT